MLQLALYLNRERSKSNVVTSFVNKNDFIKFNHIIKTYASTLAKYS